MVFDSATKISPLLPTYIQRGLSKLSANLVTTKPSGATGVLPAGHLITLLKLRADFVAKGSGKVSLVETVESELFFAILFELVLPQANAVMIRKSGSIFLFTVFNLRN